MSTSEETRALKALGKYKINELMGSNEVVSSLKAEDGTTAIPSCVMAMHESQLKIADPYQLMLANMEKFVNASASRLAQPFDCGHENGHYWMAYEWIIGNHLGEIVRDQGLPTVPQALLWASQLTEAIQTLHERGCIHQVISPASVFLSSLNQIKLLHSNWSILLPYSGNGIASLEYMSILPFIAPEVAAAKGEVNEAADIYSVGANLYFLLLGMPPHWRDEPEDLANTIQTVDCDTGGIEDLIGSDGRDLLEELLDRDPDERPANLSALGDRLKSLSDQIEQSGIPASSTSSAAVPVSNIPAAESESAPVSPDDPPRDSYGDFGAELPAGFEKPMPAQDPAYSQGVAGAEAQQVDPMAPDVGINASARAPVSALPQASLDDARAAMEQLMEPGQQDPAVQPQQIQESVQQAPPPPQAAPPPPPVAKPKSGNMAYLFITVIVLFVIVIIGGVAFLMFSGGDDDNELVDRSGVQKKKPVKVDKKQMIAEYDETIQKLFELGKLTKGYHRQNGLWPTSLVLLKEFGAQDEEFEDSWKETMDIRVEQLTPEERQGLPRNYVEEAYIVSSGIDKKWDTDDDIWIEVRDQIIGGYNPSE